MKLNRLFMLILAGVMISFNLWSQTIDQVAEKYNAAAQLINTNSSEAVKNLEEAIALAEKVGEEAEEVKIMAEGQLASMYFKLAGDLYKEKKTDEAINYFEKSIVAGNKFNDPNTVVRAKDILAKLYFSNGNTFYRSGENEKAISNLLKSIGLDPGNAKAHMLMGLTYRKMENLDEMTSSMDQAIVLAKSTGDDQTQATCEKSMRDYLAVKANQNIRANKNSEAVALLVKAIEYGEEAQTYYLLTVTYNKLKQYDEAISAAEKALPLEVDTDIEKAKIWLEIGNAQKEKGNTTEACEAYKKAAFGNFAEQANYQRQHVLKCN